SDVCSSDLCGQGLLLHLHVDVTDRPVHADLQFHLVARRGISESGACRSPYPCGSAGQGIAAGPVPRLPVPRRPTRGLVGCKGDLTGPAPPATAVVPAPREAG